MQNRSPHPQLHPDRLPTLALPIRLFRPKYRRTALNIFPCEVDQQGPFRTKACEIILGGCVEMRTEEGGGWVVVHPDLGVKTFRGGRTSER